MRGELFGVPGLELRTGVDWVRDKADQRLALTNRVWVPPMEYTSTAPVGQHKAGNIDCIGRRVF